MSITHSTQRPAPMPINEDLYRRCLATVAPIENARMLRNNHPGATDEHRDKARKVSDKSKARIIAALQRLRVATIQDVARATRLSLSAVGDVLYQHHKHGHIEREKADRTYIYIVPGCTEKKRKSAPKSTPAMEDAMAILRDHPGITNAEIAARLGVKGTRARKITHQLYEAGKVTRQRVANGKQRTFAYEVAK